MSKHRKTWSQQEKLAVVEYSKIHGAAKASRHHGVSQVSIGKWTKDYKLNGLAGLSGKRNQESIDHEKISLKKENSELKAIVAEKELQLRIQAEMLKKSH